MVPFDVASILEKGDLLYSQIPFTIRCRWWSKVKQRKKSTTIIRDPARLEDEWSWQVRTDNAPSPATVRQSPADSCMLETAQERQVASYASLTNLQRLPRM